MHAYIFLKTYIIFFIFVYLLSSSKWHKFITYIYMMQKKNLTLMVIESNMVIESFCATAHHKSGCITSFSYQSNLYIICYSNSNIRIML